MKYPFLLFFVFLLTSCSNERKVSPAFYHWKTSVQISTFEKSYLKTLQVEKIYLRFFDVIWEGQAIPTAITDVQAFDLSNTTVIPTIYITNEVMLKTPENEIDRLAERVYQKLQSMEKKLPKHIKVEEIQLDCDWSLKSKNNYFTFLKSIKKRFEGRQITATIRLHQIKFYEKTGVPPVDAGMLMFYNMGKVAEITTKNSILDLKTARPYLVNFDTYPLKLDLALPLFSWGVVFRRGKAIDLLNNLRSTSLSDTAKYEPTYDGQFRVKENHYLEGRYLYKKDLIRIETVEEQALLEAATVLNEHLNNPNLLVTFYHLDSLTLKNYPNETLENICNHLR